MNHHSLKVKYLEGRNRTIFELQEAGENRRLDDDLDYHLEGMLSGNTSTRKNCTMKLIEAAAHSSRNIMKMMCESKSFNILKVVDDFCTLQNGLLRFWLAAFVLSIVSCEAIYRIIDDNILIDLFRALCRALESSCTSDEIDSTNISQLKMCPTSRFKEKRQYSNMKDHQGAPKSDKESSFGSKRKFEGNFQSNSPVGISIEGKTDI